MSKLAQMVEGVMAIDPGEGALEYKHAWWSWGDLDRTGKAIAALLDEAGLGAGTRVGCVMRNSPEVAALLLKVICSDRCVVTINPHLPDAQLADDVRRLKPAVLVAGKREWEREALVAAVRETGCLGIELTGARDVPARALPMLGHVAGADLQVSAAPGIAIEMLTSGTTGVPKRIPLSLRAFEQAVLDSSAYEGGEGRGAPVLRSGVGVFNAPFAHIAGIFRLFNTVVAGRKFVLLEKFSVDEFVDAVRRYRPKVAAAPPSALRMLLDAGVAVEDLASLRAFRTSTAPLDPDLADEFTAKYGVPVLQNYSATEFAGAGAGWTIEDYRQHHKAKRGSVGRVNPGIKARVVDPASGSELARGERGLLEILAPHLGNGRDWLRTTDLALLDEDDFLWIVGRADNAIIRGGFKVFPDDIVRALERHPAILEAAVTSLPDARLGMVPVAAFIARSGAACPSETEVLEFVRPSLLPYQVPAQVMALDELPRTPSLKVSQPALREIFLALAGPSSDPAERKPDHDR